MPLLVVALLVALMPLSLLAAGPAFSDLGTAAPVHQPNIQAIGDAGITTGFEDPADPTKRLYNPKDNVTREEMASFLARTAGLGTNPPVANAKTAQTATNASNAANATTVGGYAPNALLRVDFSARTSGMGLPLTGSALSLREVSINVPGPGYVMVLGHTGIFGSSACPCTGRASVRDLAAPNPESANHYETVEAAGQYGDLTVTWVFPVTGAGTRTYALEADETAGNANAFFPSIAAIFIPFGSANATASGTEMPGIPGEAP